MTPNHIKVKETSNQLCCLTTITFIQFENTQIIRASYILSISWINDPKPTCFPALSSFRWSDVSNSRQIYSTNKSAMNFKYALIYLFFPLSLSLSLPNYCDFGHKPENTPAKIYGSKTRFQITIYGFFTKFPLAPSQQKHSNNTLFVSGTAEKKHWQISNSNFSHGLGSLQLKLIARFSTGCGGLVGRLRKKRDKYLMHINFPLFFLSVGHTTIVAAASCEGVGFFLLFSLSRFFLSPKFPTVE